MYTQTKRSEANTEAEIRSPISSPNTRIHYRNPAALFPIPTIYI